MGAHSRGPLMALTFGISLVVACAPRPTHSDVSPPTEHRQLPSAAKALDPGFELPSGGRTPHDDDSIVILETPRGHSGVRAVLTAFFSAISRESGPDLAKTLTGNAMSHFPNGRSTAALTGWMRRFAQDDYRVVAQQRLPGPGPIETYTAGQVKRLSSLRDFHLLPEDDELLAVVQVDSVPLLGVSMLFVLRPSGDGYEIRAMYEDSARL